MVLVASLCLAAGPGFAAPLQKSEVSPAANWVAHVDLEAFRGSVFGKLVLAEIQKQGLDATIASGGKTIDSFMNDSMFAPAHQTILKAGARSPVMMWMTRSDRSFLDDLEAIVSHSTLVSVRPHGDLTLPLLLSEKSSRPTASTDSCTSPRVSGETFMPSTTEFQVETSWASASCSMIEW